LSKRTYNPNGMGVGSVRAGSGEAGEVGEAKTVIERRVERKVRERILGRYMVRVCVTLAGSDGFW
jgi:hypothetical protein